MEFRQNHNQPQHDLEASLRSDSLESMKELVAYIVRFLVDHPDQVEVNEVEGEQTHVLELKVAKQDMGKVIGKQGRTARAIRTILNGASARLHKRAVLEILE